MYHDYSKQNNELTSSTDHLKYEHFKLLASLSLLVVTNNSFIVSSSLLSVSSFISLSDVPSVLLSSLSLLLSSSAVKSTHCQICLNQDLDLHHLHHHYQ